MLEEQFRHHYQRYIVNPIADKFKQSISPNSVTLLAGLLGLLIIPALWFQQSLLAILLLLLSGYCDTLDGTLARTQQNSSPWGSVLDITMDRLVEFFILFGLWLVDPIHRSLTVILMLGSVLICITSFLVVGIFSENTSNKGFYYSPGIMERAEAFIFFIFMIVFPTQFNRLAWMFSLLVLLTAIIRLYQFYTFQLKVNFREN